MPSSGSNPRFEVFINGKSSHIIGIEEFGVLAFGIDWVRRHPAEKPAEYTDDDWELNATRIHVGGLDANRKVHVSWFHGDLEIGDEITVRVLPPGDFDQPTPYHFDPKS